MSVCIHGVPPLEGSQEWDSPSTGPRPGRAAPPPPLALSHQILGWSRDKYFIDGIVMTSNHWIFVDWWDTNDGHWWDTSDIIDTND